MGFQVYPPPPTTDVPVSSRFPRVNTPRVVQANPNSTSYVTIVSVSDGSGYLLGVYAGIVGTAGTNTCFAEIVLDDTTVIAGAAVCYTDAGDYACQNPVVGPLYFGSSMEVKGRESSASAYSRFLVTYCLASPVREKIAEWEELEEDAYTVRKYKVEEVINHAGNVVTIRILQESIMKTKILCIGPSEVRVGATATFRVEYLDWQGNPLPNENRPIHISVVGPGQAQELVLTPTNGQAEFDFVSEVPGAFVIRATAEFPCEPAEVEVVVS